MLCVLYACICSDDCVVVSISRKRVKVGTTTGEREQAG